LEERKSHQPTPTLRTSIDSLSTRVEECYQRGIIRLNRWGSDFLC